MKFTSLKSVLNTTEIISYRFFATELFFCSSRSEAAICPYESYINQSGIITHLSMTRKHHLIGGCSINKVLTLRS